MEPCGIWMTSSRYQAGPHFPKGVTNNVIMSFIIFDIDKNALSHYNAGDPSWPIVVGTIPGSQE